MPHKSLLAAGLAAFLSLPAAADPLAAYVPGRSGEKETPERVFFDNISRTHIHGTGRYAVAPTPVAVRKEAYGFILADDVGCQDGNDDAQFCSLAQPKPWTEHELGIMIAVLAKLHAAGLDSFFRKVQRNGFNTLLRETTVTHFKQDEGWRRLPYPNSLHTNRQLVIADQFFRISDVVSAEKVTMHLLAHAYDFGRSSGPLFFPALSNSPDFLRMTGFRLSKGNWDISGMSSPEREQFYAMFKWKNNELLKLQTAQQDPDRGKKDRRIRLTAESLAKKYRVPSFHSMLNPYESFAEWVLYVQFEPTKAAALNPELARWIKAKVLGTSAAKL